jgi:GTPase involved in cell partitioning and DNA repair
MVKAYRTIRGELTAYDNELAAKPEVVLWTKADILPDKTLREFKDTYIERFLRETGCPEPVLVISAIRGDGLSALLGLLAGHLGLELNRLESDGKVPEYIEGEAPEGLNADELSMENLESVEETSDG